MVSPCCRSACSAGSCSGSLFAPGSLGESRWTSKTRFELTHHANNSEKTGQGRIHDQLRRGALQAASANPALVRARGAAEAVALARKYAALHGCGFGTVGSDPDAGARHGREPGRNRNYFEYARDRKSTRLNSSHGYISYAVFCLKKKKNKNKIYKDNTHDMILDAAV